MKTERGDWHRRDRRGGGPPFVAGAQQYRCRFCEKTFETKARALGHEKQGHRKKMRRMNKMLLITELYDRGQSIERLARRQHLTENEIEEWLTKQSKLVTKPKQPHPEASG